MREMSDILNTESAMQIRYLDTMMHLASSTNSKVVVIPKDSTNSGDTAKLKKFLVQNELRSG